MNQHIREFNQVSFVQVPRDQNSEENEVARYTLSEDRTSLLNLKLEIKKSPNIEKFCTFLVQGLSNWMSPILFYLRDRQLPSDSDEARKGKKRANRFTILNSVLYKRGFSLPYSRCVEEDEAKYILEEFQEGICKDHMGARSLVGKIIKAGYFWPTMQREAKEFVKRCDSCQRYENFQRMPGEKMTVITSPRPFAQ